MTEKLPAAETNTDMEVDMTQECPRTPEKATAAQLAAQLALIVAAVKQTYAEEVVTTPAAEPALIQHGTATVQFNGLTASVGFDIHSDTPVDEKEKLIRLAALRCASGNPPVFAGAWS